jgi:hypothetical protein
MDEGIIIGDCIQTMVMASIYLRDNAALQYQALQLGEPKYLSMEEAMQATRVSESDIAVQRAWGCWVQRAKRAMPDLP